MKLADTQLCSYAFSVFPDMESQGLREKTTKKQNKIKKNTTFAWLRAQTLESSAAFEPKPNIQMPREH